MQAAPQHLKPAVAASIAIWHDMVAKRDLSALPSIVHPDAVFSSPMAIHPYQPAAALILALNTVIQVFEDFTYHRQLASDDGLNVVREFSARQDCRVRGDGAPLKRPAGAGRGDGCTVGTEDAGV